MAKNAMRDPAFMSFEPGTAFTRRDFVMTALATGFAWAVQPIAAQTRIITDTKGLDAGEVKVPVKDGEIPAYQARPSGKRDCPVVLVVQEIFGVHEHIKDICRRLAKAGYLAVAPELYARQGDVSKIEDINAIIPIVLEVPDAQVMSDLDAAAAWASTHGGDESKLAVTGFCWGGRIVWLYAAHNPRLKAAASWYGQLEGKTAQIRPKQPLDLVGDLKAPVLGLYGGADAGNPETRIERMRAAMKAAGKSGEIHVYPEAPHGFLADYRPTYRKEAADDAWRRMIDWFRKNGVA